MSYLTISHIAQDRILLDRVAACAAQEGIHAPFQWANDHMLVLAASPGWDSAWAYAQNTGNEDPGSDESVITDGMILAAVQPLK